MNPRDRETDEKAVEELKNSIEQEMNAEFEKVNLRIPVIWGFLGVYSYEYLFKLCKDKKDTF